MPNAEQVCSTLLAHCTAPVAQTMAAQAPDSQIWLLPHTVLIHAVPVTLHVANCAPSHCVLPGVQMIGTHALFRQIAFDPAHSVVVAICVPVASQVFCTLPSHVDCPGAQTIGLQVPAKHAEPLAQGVVFHVTLLAAHVAAVVTS